MIRNLMPLLLASVISSPITPVLAEGLAPLKTREVQLTILTDPNEMTVYLFDKDTDGVSNCEGGCAKVWPPVRPTQDEVKVPLSVIIRKDKTRQLAFKQRPVYLYAGDEKPGEINGDGLDQIWHVIHP